MENTRILVLEDDPDMLDLLSQVLEDHGYQVTPVSRAEDAVQAVREIEFDLIVADIRMEGMSGLDAVEQSREHRPDIGSLIVSGYATPENTARAMSLQSGKILAKPFSLQDFLARVQEQLALRQRKFAKSQRESTYEDGLSWALEQIALLSYLPPSSVPADLYRDLAQSLARELGFPAAESKEVGLAAAVASIGNLDEAPENFLADTSVFATFKYCLIRHLDPLDVEPIPRLEARIVAFALEAIREGKDSYRSPEEMAERDADSRVLEAYRRLRQGATENIENRTGSATARSLLSLAATLRSLGAYDGARNALNHAVEEGDIRSRLAGHLGLAHLELDQGRSDQLTEQLKRSVDIAVKLGPVTYATTLLKAALMTLESGRDARKLLRAAERELRELGFQGSVALAHIALLSQGEEVPSKSLELSLQALTAPRYAEEVSAATGWLIPSALKLFCSLESPHPRNSLLLLFNLFTEPTIAVLSGDTVKPDTQLEILQQAAEDKAPGLSSNILESLCRDANREVAVLAQKLAAKSSLTDDRIFLRCQSFGHFQVHYGETPISDKDWRTKKVRHFFAYLAAQWGHYLSEDIILEHFWPNKERDKGKRNLYWATSMVRRAFSASGENLKHLIERREETLRLNPEIDYWHDIQEFDRVYQAGMKAYNGQDYRVARQQLSQMAEIYRGPYLDGNYDPWAHEKREQFELQASEGFGFLAQACFQIQDYLGAVEAARRTLEIDPISEEANIAIMQAFLSQKKSQSASQHFEAYRALLETEYGLTPSEELLALHQQAQA